MFAGLFIHFGVFINIPLPGLSDSVATKRPKTSLHLFNLWMCKVAYTNPSEENNFSEPLASN